MTRVGHVATRAAQSSRSGAWECRWQSEFPPGGFGDGGTLRRGALGVQGVWWGRARRCWVPAPLNSCLLCCALGWGPGTQIVSCKFQYGRVLNRLQGRVARSAAGVRGALLPTHSSAVTRSLSPTAISRRRCGVSAPPHYRSHIRPQQRQAAAGLQTPTSTGREKGKGIKLEGERLKRGKKSGREPRKMMKTSEPTTAVACASLKTTLHCSCCSFSAGLQMRIGSGAIDRGSWYSRVTDASCKGASP